MLRFMVLFGLRIRMATSESDTDGTEGFGTMPASVCVFSSSLMHTSGT